jgi:hypothetical protein
MTTGFMKILNFFEILKFFEFWNLVKILKFWTLKSFIFFIMQNTGKWCVILLVFIILRWALNYESNVFRYNKILIDCVFGNSKFVVPSTLTIDLGFASVNNQCFCGHYIFECNHFNQKREQSLSNYLDIDIILLNFLNLGKKQYWRKSVIS